MPPAAAQSADATHAERFANEFGFFVGGTDEDRRENGLTLGLTYERRFNKTFGIGIEGERVLGDLDFWVLTVPFKYHYKKATFFAGPGIEIPDDGENEFVARIGAEYAFELEAGWEISPGLAFDFVDGDTAVVGGLKLTRNY